MNTVPSTREWSDPVAVAGGTRLQAHGGRIAIHLTDDTPDAAATGIILAPGETMDIPAGEFRHRAVTKELTRLSYQAWG